MHGFGWWRNGSIETFLAFDSGSTRWRQARMMRSRVTWLWNDKCAHYDVDCSALRLALTGCWRVDGVDSGMLQSSTGAGLATSFPGEDGLWSANDSLRTLIRRRPHGHRRNYHRVNWLTCQASERKMFQIDSVPFSASQRSFQRPYLFLSPLSFFFFPRYHPFSILFLPVLFRRWESSSAASTPLTAGSKCLPEKVGRKVKNWKQGGIFLVANCLEMHGTECDNSAYNSSNFFCSLRSQTTCRPYFHRCIYGGSIAGLNPLCNFYARKQLLLSARLSHRNILSVRLSVCLSDTLVDQSKRCKLGLPNLYRRLPRRL